MRADVVVVGGGIAGISVAAEVAASRTVVVVEREPSLTHHTTGRSAAAYLQSYGTPEVRRLTAMSHAALSEQIDGTTLLTPRPLLWVAAHDAEAELKQLLADQPDLYGLDAQETVGACPVLRAAALAGGALDPTGEDIDVLALHQRYVRTFRERGGAILTAAGQVRFTRSPAGWALQTGAGTVEADVLVDAAGPWADAVAEACGIGPLGLRPLRRTLAVARSSSPELHPGLPFVFDVGETCYFRPEGPNVLISPADEAPSTPCDATAEMEDVAQAIERVNEITTLGIRSIVSAWAGLRTFAPDRNPVVGFADDDETFFWFAGQGGYGIQMAPALARLGATWLTVGQPPPEWPGDLLDRVDARR